MERKFKIYLPEKEWMKLDHLVFIVEEATGYENRQIAKLRAGLSELKAEMDESPKATYALELSARELKILANLAYQVSEVVEYDETLDKLYHKLDNIYYQITGRYL